MPSLQFAEFANGIRKGRYGASNPCWG